MPWKVDPPRWHERSGPIELLRVDGTIVSATLTIEKGSGPPVCRITLADGTEVSLKSYLGWRRCDP